MGSEMCIRDRTNTAHAQMIIFLIPMFSVPLCDPESRSPCPSLQPAADWLILGLEMPIHLMVYVYHKLTRLGCSFRPMLFDPSGAARVEES